jgi:hypothetical protein
MLPVPPLVGLAAVSAAAIEDRPRGLRLRVGPSDATPWRWRLALPEGGALVRARRAGDRVGTTKVSDILGSAKVLRPLRDLVGIVSSGSDVWGVIGHEPTTSTLGPASGTLVLDVEPVMGSWAREMAWSGM